MTDILLVESDQKIRNKLADIFSLEGFEVISVASLHEARNTQLKTETPLLVTNLLLDDGAAFEFLGEWTGPSIALTETFVGPTARQFLTEHGQLLDVLEYPYDSNRLLDRLREHYREAYPASTVVSESSSGDTDQTRNPYVLPARLDLAHVPMSGNLEEYEVAALLARLAVDRVNGALMLQSQRTKKLVYFEDGAPVGVKSNLLEECLGRMLITEGRLSEAACEQSLGEMRRTRRQQGEILVSIGELAEEDLEPAVRRQFLKKFWQLFTWDEGEYRYRDAATPAAYHGQRDDPAHMIWSGIMESYPNDRLRERMEPLLPSIVIWTGTGLDLTRLMIPEGLRQVLNQIDGDRRASEVIAHQDDRDAALQLLYALTVLGTVTYLSPDLTALK